jgi:adenylate kinase
MRNFKIFIIYGPPGSGKGTQARILARQLGIEHFDTGRIIEKLVHDPNKQDDLIIQRERKNFDTGLLCTPKWVLGIVSEKIKKSKKRKGLIFSGSPRTLEEAKIIIPLLEEMYGKDNICVIQIFRL